MLEGGVGKLILTLQGGTEYLSALLYVQKRKWPHRLRERCGGHTQKEETLEGKATGLNESHNLDTGLLAGSNLKDLSGESLA